MVGVTSYILLFIIGVIAVGAIILLVGSVYLTFKNRKNKNNDHKFLTGFITIFTFAMLIVFIMLLFFLMYNIYKWQHIQYNF